MSRPAGSLRVRLLAWMALPVLAVLGVGLALSLASARRQATASLERDILASARMIAEQTRFRGGAVRVVVPPAALELLASDSHDEVAWAVFDADGRLIAGFPGLDLPEGADDPAGPAFFAATFRTERMRAVTLAQPVVTPEGTVAVRVLVGETLMARDARVARLWQRGFAEQSALVVAAAAAIWIGINRELRPLLALRRAVLARGAGSFEPFAADRVQTEVRPLVEALNDHMARLAGTLARQRRFLDSTAHQMRTPLTVLKTQVALARRSGPVEAASVLREIDATLTALSRVTSQLLTLGRVTHDRAHVAVEAVDLAALVRAVAGAAAGRALDAGVELGVEADRPCPVAASAILLREAVANLVDNAVAHAGPGTLATLAVAREGDLAVLSVCDTGRGVAPADRARLFQRFAQGSGATGGSGLGLALVAEIAQMFGGRAEILDPPGGRGFAVRLELPALQRTASTKALV